MSRAGEPALMNRQCGIRASKGARVIATVMVAVLLLTQVSYAHSPSDMQVSYDTRSRQLAVAITHQVSGPGSHYVREIVVRVDGREMVAAAYTSQPSPSSFTYTYPLNATPGSIIAVSAHCSLGGSIQRSIPVTGDAAGGSTPGPDTPAPTKSPPSVLLVPALLAVVLAIWHRTYGEHPVTGGPAGQGASLSRIRKH